MSVHLLSRPRIADTGGALRRRLCGRLSFRSFLPLLRNELPHPRHPAVLFIRSLEKPHIVHAFGKSEARLSQGCRFLLLRLGARRQPVSGTRHRLGTGDGSHRLYLPLHLRANPVDDGVAVAQEREVDVLHDVRDGVAVDEDLRDAVRDVRKELRDGRNLLAPV